MTSSLRTFCQYCQFDGIIGKAGFCSNCDSRKCIDCPDCDDSSGKWFENRHLLKQHYERKHVHTTSYVEMKAKKEIDSGIFLSKESINAFSVEERIEPKSYPADWQ